MVLQKPEGPVEQDQRVEKIQGDDRKKKESKTESIKHFTRLPATKLMITYDNRYGVLMANSKRVNYLVAVITKSRACSVNVTSEKRPPSKRAVSSGPVMKSGLK